MKQEYFSKMCNCYVMYLDAVTRYGLHNGTHNPKCNWYNPSRDPVDRANDEEFRARTEISAPGVSDNLA